ncbi:ABC transporter ATP-binding protein [Kallipyga gabonensis]|uniref:ABC transporter ATP-binding protein n=1 Tax=Kallipyga gabonensis TaxID=1686287 RepID=UPI0006B42C32|nr:ABC transporter ATP-binding protein [Kallipyga gabonensis]
MQVKLENIGKKYEGREEFTLRHINLDIKSQDFCVILGPSGCGKSTLLRMIAGLNSITEGELIFGDRLVNNVPPKDRDIAMVFQSYALYPHMTVYDNMAFSLKMRKERKGIIDKRVKDAAKLLQIENYLYSRPSDISGGQRQRVALGRAIVRKPSIFLMDEPLSNLDAKLREHMRVELVRIHQQMKTTTIYVTHDQTEAMTMATKIVLLDKGQIQQAGAPDEFYNLPANTFVAQFIGSPTMNLLEGKMVNGVFVTDNNEVRIEPSAKDSERLRPYEGKKVIAGIRSERFLRKESTDKNHFISHVDVIENLGKEQSLFVKLPSGKDLVMTMPGHYRFAQGEEEEFAFDNEAMHYFDGESKERI